MKRNGWITATIDSLLKTGAIIGHKDGNHGADYPRIEEFCSVGVPFLTAKSLHDGEVDIDNAPRLAEERANRLRFGFVEPGDVLLSHNATVGRVAIVPNFTGRLLIGTSLTYFRVNPQKLSARYLAAYFAGRNFQDQLAAVMSFSTRNQVPITLQRRLSVVVPPLPEQHAIASVLGTLDDKIELNRRMNETLEAMAQALFKFWFIDATHDGVPEGWHESTIGEEVRVVGGSTPSTKEAKFWDQGTILWATPKDLSSVDSPVLLDTERRITDSGLAQISSGLLPRGAILLSSRAPIGYLAISEVPVAVNQGFIAMVCNKVLPNYYVRLWVQANMDLIKANANGTTFQEISKANFRPLRIVVPPKSALDDFSQLIEPLHQKTVSNLRESLMLAALRDALLPKLLSGELRIPNPERIGDRS
jgi:type I restriction enzyme S subunit